MRYKQVIFIFLLLTLAFSMSFVQGETNEQDISVIQMVHNSSNLLISIDYDISAAPGRGETESVVLLILLTPPGEPNTPNIGSLLFIRTNSGNRLLYWILNDPFSSAELWKQGMEDVHFQVDYKDLSIIFIESPDMEDPNLEIISFAKLLDIGNINDTVIDFQPILEKFRADYEFIRGPEISEVTTTTTSSTSIETETSTEPSTITAEVTGYPGVLIPLSLGLLVLIGLKRRNRD